MSKESKIKKGDRFGTLLCLSDSYSTWRDGKRHLNSGQISVYKISMVDVKCNCGKEYSAIVKSLHEESMCIDCKHSGQSERMANGWMTNPNQLKRRIKKSHHLIEEAEEKVDMWMGRAAQYEKELARFQLLLKKVEE